MSICCAATPHLHDFGPVGVTDTALLNRRMSAPPHSSSLAIAREEGCSVTRRVSVMSPRSARNPQRTTCRTTEARSSCVLLFRGRCSRSTQLERTPAFQRGCSSTLRISSNTTLAGAARTTSPAAPNSPCGPRAACTRGELALSSLCVARGACKFAAMVKA